MGKKRGKKKGGKNKSPKKPQEAAMDASQQQDTPLSADAEAEVEADAGDATSSLSPPARPSLDAVAHEESFRQSLLAVIDSVEDSGGEANAGGSTHPDEQTVQDVVSLEETNDGNEDDSLKDTTAVLAPATNEGGDIVDKAPAEVDTPGEEAADGGNAEPASIADDATVPHSNSIEFVGGIGDDGLPDLPDEPIITTSFGSNSVEDELNEVDVSAEMMVERRTVGETEEDGADVDDEDAVASIGSESASQVTSDFTLGGQSNISKDSAIAALASLSRDPQGDIDGGAVDGSISPLNLTKGVSAEDGEDTNALPPLDTSVDASPEISLAGSRDGDVDDEGSARSDADEELDREINISLGAIAGEPSPTKASGLHDASLQTINSIDSTGVEIGNDVLQVAEESDDSIDKLTSSNNDGTESDDEGKPSAAAAAAAAVALGTAGVALGAATIAGSGEIEELERVKDIYAVPMITDDAPHGDDTVDKDQTETSPDDNENRAIDEAVISEVEENVATDDVAQPFSDNSLEGVEVEPSIQVVAEENDGDNPFDSFVSEEAADDDENSDKEWISSVLVAGAAGAAVAGGAAALAANEDSDYLDSTVMKGSNATENTPTSPADINETNDMTVTETEEGEEEDSNAGKATAGAVAAGVVGAAAVAGVGAAGMPANSDNVPDLNAPENDGDAAKKAIGNAVATESAAVSPSTIAVNTSMGSKGSMDSGQYYSHGTFSEDEESDDSDKKSENSDGVDTGALAAAGVAAGAAGTAGIVAAGAGGLQPAPEDTPEEEEFTVISSPSKSMDKMADESTDKLLADRDVEKGMVNDIPEAGSFAAASSPHSSTNDSSPSSSKKEKNREKATENNKKKALLMATGALVLLGGIVGIVLAFTLGRGEEEQSVTPSPTPSPTDPTPSMPVPSDLPTPGVLFPTSPTASPIDGIVPPPPQSASPTEAPQTTVTPTSAPQSIAPTQTPKSEVPTPSPTSKVPTLLPTSEVPTPAPESEVPTPAPESNAPTQPQPTVTPTTMEYAETLEGLQTYFGEVVPDPAALEDPGSPQYEAVSWLTSDLIARGVSRRMLQQSSAEEITITQRYTLATLWFATGGSNWTIVVESEDNQWLSAGPECGWEGVICSHRVSATVRDSSPTVSTQQQNNMKSHLRSRRKIQAITMPNSTAVPTAQDTPEPTPSPSTEVVSGLELDESNLTGELPADIVLLSDLKYFAAPNNAIARIPSELGALSQLERIYLNNNVIGGQIATELGSLTKLMDLRLNNNRFVKKIPSALGNLLSLDSLELHHNELSGSMPDFVCSLRFVGEDDVLDRLTSDCASNNDDPPKVECDCCTECFVGIGETLVVPPPSPSPTFSKLDDTNPPTPFPTSEANTILTSKKPTATGNKRMGSVDFTILSQEGALSPEVETDGAESPEVETEAEGSTPATSEELVENETPAEEDTSTPGARDEIQSGIGRDSNDWYEILYGEQIDNGQR